MFCGVALIGGCASRAPAASPATPAARTTAPAGWTGLAGPTAAPDGLTDRHAITGGSGGIVAVAMVPGSRARTPLLAFETAQGWFAEAPPPPPPHPEPTFSHHEPQSSWYDLAATRTDGGRVILSHRYSHSVFYPGQGGEGSSSTSWSERECRMFGAALYCSPLKNIATEHCTMTQGAEPPPAPPAPAGSPPTIAARRGIDRKCTGGPPPGVKQ